MIKYCIIGFLGVLLFSSCEKSKLNAKEYKEWYSENDNSLESEKRIGEFIYKLKYLPVEAIILEAIKNNPEVTRDELLKIQEEQKDIQTFLFRIELDIKGADPMKYQLKDQIEYQKRVEYYSFIVKNDIFLVDGNDTLPCIIHHFERYYGSAPYLNLMVGFKGTSNCNDKKLIYNDIVFNNGIIKLTINKEEIENIPELTI